MLSHRYCETEREEGALKARKRKVIDNDAPWKRLAASTSLAAPLKVILLAPEASAGAAAAAAEAAPEVVGASEPVMVTT